MAKSISKIKQKETQAAPAPPPAKPAAASNGHVKNIEHYREMLQEKAGEIRRSMSTPAAAEIVARREEPNDYVDLADKSHEEWIFLNRNAQNASLLRQVEEAIERIEDGTYGICELCGEEISDKRLEARPVTTCCIDCKKEEEEQEKSRNNV